MPMVDFDPPPATLPISLQYQDLWASEPAWTLCWVENFLAHAGATLSTTNPTSITLGSSLILHGEGQATNPLDHGLTNIHLNRMLDFIPTSQTIQSVCIINEKEIA